MRLSRQVNGARLLCNQSQTGLHKAHTQLHNWALELAKNARYRAEKDAEAEVHTGDTTVSDDATTTDVEQGRQSAYKVTNNKANPEKLSRAKDWGMITASTEKIMGNIASVKRYKLLPEGPGDEHGIVLV